MGLKSSAVDLLFAAALALTTATAPLRAAEESSDPLVEIVVTATLRSIPLLEMPGSVSVLSGRALHDAGQEHFEDVLPLVPNLNWAGDTSRPRYFQIRGIGELQQYQGAPNPSVAFLIDDIDFSGLGSVATLFDVDHIEVLHGPQGTAYGANALAGLIYVKSAEPAETFGGRAEFDVGDYDERSYGAVLTGPLNSLDSAFRLAVERYTSDGFYRNEYLGRSNTDARDELTMRGKWRYQPNDQWRVDLTLLRVEINNGYDAFAIDNSRITQSDHPGVDGQYSTGLAARATYTGLAPVTLTTIATYADTTVNYGFDGDWGNPKLWAPYTFDFTEYQDRHRSTRSLEFRLGDAAPGSASGFSWTFGVYAFELRESLTDLSAGLYVDPFDATQNSDTLTAISSAYTSRNGALYAQLDGDLWRGVRWSLGLRGERHTSNYNDTTTNLDAPTTANNFNPAENLWGGHASVDAQVAEGEHLYALIARGYKAGGFNLSPGLPASQLLYSPESDLNLELGHKAQLDDGQLRIDTSLFYMLRHSEQLLTGEQLDPSNPNTFIFYTGNALSGYNYGLESTLEWAAARRLEFGASLGLLQSQYHGFVQNGVEYPDRALPHAPPWNAALNATWRDPRGPYARLDVTGMGAFFYDLPPNWTRSSAYGLVNAKLGWGNERWEAYLWGRNLLDKNYTVRGFYFGDEPPDFPNKLYTQLGEPRNFGLHLTIRFSH
ncbi:MAG TPA: TonB-dependent receptor [Steroidobacteraceae bacterium]|jgi:iron complex outermembrane receptor protein|nr:TonB-dependent receptor [Steroidobacteraceae bacterium]